MELAAFILLSIVSIGSAIVVVLPAFRNIVVCALALAMNLISMAGFFFLLDAQFIGAARSGERLVAKAERSGGGRSIFFSSCRVLGAGGRLVGQGGGTFKYITKSA